MGEVSVLKIRIKFSKHGAMKFIGHLDMMRFFQKVLRRAEIDIAFTEGFSPHMVMSFALPLGVGMTSDSEYVDIEIKTPISTREALERLNSVMVEGVHVTGFRRIEDGKASKAMSLVAAADFTVAFREGCEPPQGWQASWEAFLKQEQIVVCKKTKKSEKEEDIRPMIYHSECQDGKIRMQLAAGSAANLKPELVLQAFAGFLGWEMPEFALLVNRDELYADIGEGERKLVPLEDLGRDIEG